MFHFTVKINDLGPEARPMLEALPRAHGIELTHIRDAKELVSLLVFDAPKAIPNDIFEKIVECLELLHPEMEVEEYINE